MDRVRSTARIALAPTLATLAVAFAALGSQAPGTASPAAEPPISAASKDDSTAAKQARNIASDWMAKKGWVRGINPDGSFVSIGTSSFNAKSGTGALARSMAFQRASLKAKNELAEFRSKAIETRVLAEMSSGTMPNQDDAQEGEELIDALAKSATKKAEAGDPAASNRISEKSAQVIRTVARSEVAGSSVSNTFEFDNGGGEGAFAVVMRFSPTSRQVARAALGQGDAPSNSDLLDAVTWANGVSASELARCYGARLMKDQKTNEVVVVSFGQADVRGDSELAQEMAREIAKTDADGAMRQFVGELVESEGTLVRATRMEEVEGSGLTIKDAEALQKRFEARAEALDFQGLSPIREWDGQFAGSRPVVGVVMMWSVTLSNSANLLGRELEEIGASKGGAGRRNLPVGQDGDAPIKPKGRDYPPLTPGTKGPETPEP